MHNGSVPNLYEMLLPARERTKKFCVGREFDPVKVGLDTTCTTSTFELDTALRGTPTPDTRSRKRHSATASSGRC
jgi:hypothetical protein